jgi:hypothetical protein
VSGSDEEKKVYAGDGADDVVGGLDGGYGKEEGRGKCL